MTKMPDFAMSLADIIYTFLLRESPGGVQAYERNSPTEGPDADRSFLQEYIEDELNKLWSNALRMVQEAYEAEMDKHHEETRDIFSNAKT